jgi:sigma-B regulation protein RsbU (phosphoserine phosphatase)
MQRRVLTRIHDSVEEKQKNLDSWLQTAPERQKEICLCGEDQQVQKHLAVLHQTLEKAENENLGICEICHANVDQSILEIDYTATICLDHLTENQRRQLEAELEFSSVVQRALLPIQAPDIPHMEVGAFSRPAQIVGGDYFDFFRFKSGAYGIVIADVMGHGIAASLIMSSLQTALKTLAAETDSVVEVIRRINRYYLHNINLTTFVTVFLGKFDPSKGQLTYVNAGHNPPLLFHQNGASSLSWLAPTGAAIGVMEEYRVRSKRVTLKPEDVLLLYTDGVTELTNPAQEYFGPERLAGRLTANARLSPQELVSTLRKELDEFHGSGAPSDDVTLVAARVLE